MTPQRRVKCEGTDRPAPLPRRQRKANSGSGTVETAQCQACGQWVRVVGGGSTGRPATLAQHRRRLGV